MNHYDQELVEAFSKSAGHTDVKFIESSEVIFAKLQQAFPVAGSKIDWARAVEYTVRYGSAAVAAEEFASFFERICADKNLTGEVAYVGDSATEIAAICSIDLMQKVLNEIVKIPQHHYLVGPEAAWCFSFTMEGDMAFGFSPFVD